MSGAPVASGAAVTAVMQPYLFPYIGYFQLLHACQHFVLLDDAAFIRQGWINRNRILLHGAAYTFTIPLAAQSSFAPINGTMLLPDNGWKGKLIKTIDQAYRRAPHHTAVLALVEGVILAADADIASAAERSLRACMAHIGLVRPMIRSSALNLPLGLKGQERVIAICETVGTGLYVNAPGGRDLYSSAAFKAHGMDLRFLVPGEITYAQGRGSFVPGLSIIDVLMWNTPEQVRGLLARYTLEP